MSDRPLQEGDYVRFRYLPRDCEPTPIRVSAVAPNGMILLLNRGWFQQHLLKRVTQFAQPARRRKKAA